ncbi:MAG: hypothetical protein U0805_18650 [Pirellulales bacterium]
MIKWPQQLPKPMYFAQHLRGQQAVPLPHHEAQPVPQPQPLPHPHAGSQQLPQPQAGSQASPHPHGEPQPQAPWQPLSQPTHGQTGACDWHPQVKHWPAYWQPLAKQPWPQPQHGSQQLSQPQAGSQQLSQPHDASQPQPQSPWIAQHELCGPQSKPKRPRTPAFDCVGVQESAASIAAAISRFRISRILRAARGATGVARRTAPKTSAPPEAALQLQRIELGRTALGVIVGAARHP